MNALTFKRTICVIAVLLSGVAQDAWGQVQYTLTDLGTFSGGATSIAYGINNLGQVVGNSSSGGYAHAFLYSGGSLQNLGTLGGLASSAAAINNAGQIVGEALTSSGVGQAFLDSGGSMQGLGAVPVGGTSYATGINNLGQVVWYSNATVGGTSQAFLDSGGSMQNLGTLAAPYDVMSVVNGINDNGQAVGGSFTGTSGYASHAFLFSGGSMQDLGTLPAQPDSVATAINNLGQIVGYGNTNGAASHAFLDSGGSLQSLGTLSGGPSSVPTAINNLGQIVGESLTSSDAAHAFLYSGGTMQDLNTLITSTSGWTLTDATGINDSGQICGYGIDPAGQTHAFLLTPVSASPADQWAVNGGGNWSTPSNWTNMAVPGETTTASLALGIPNGNAQDMPLFGPVLTSGTATVILDASRILGGLSLYTTAGASYVISPSGASTLTLANTAGSVTISNSGGNHEIDAPVILGSNLSVSATTGSSLTIAGNISGGSSSYSLNLSGGGALNLSGSNTYTGTTTISAGVLQIGNGGASGSLSTSSSITDNGTLIFDRGNTVTQGVDFSAAGIGGSGSLTQAGPGLLVLTASNSYTGGTTVSAGSLQIGNGATGSVAGNIVDNGLLAFNLANNSTFAGVISGSGGLTQLGPGILVLTASNSYTGVTTISAGTLQIDDGGNSGSITGNVVNNAVLAFDRADAYTYSGSITGSGSLLMNGPGTLSLAGTGTVSIGNITVNQGQIIAGPGSVNVAGNLTIPPGERFTYSGSSLFVTNLSNSGTFIGGGTVSEGFVNASSGIVRLAAGQTLLLQNSGPTSNAGSIQVFGSAASPVQFESTGPFTNASGGMFAVQNATLNFDAGLTNQATVSFTSGASNVFGAVTNNPGATIILTGGAYVTFYGDVVQNGTLDVSTVGGTASAVFLGAYSGSGTITGGGVVEMLGDPDLSGNLAISAPLFLASSLEVAPSAGQTMRLSGDINGNAGSLTLGGGGQLILSGTNGYRGGTIVEAGTLDVANSDAIPEGTSLTIGAGGALLFASATAAGPALASPGAVAVPEPATLILSCVAGMVLLGYAKTRVRRGCRQPFRPSP